MARYFIEYDLKEGADYQPLFDALSKLGAKKHLLSAWHLDMSQSGQCEELRDYLLNFIDRHSRLIVSEIKGCSQYNAINDPSSGLTSAIGNSLRARGLGFLPRR